MTQQYDLTDTNQAAINPNRPWLLLVTVSGIAAIGACYADVRTSKGDLVVSMRTDGTSDGAATVSGRVVTLTIPVTVCRTLPPGTHLWDLVVVLDGTPETVLAGTAVVKARVTRPELPGGGP